MNRHKYEAEIVWQCEGNFDENNYSRGHQWKFDGGVVVPASSSPLVVPLPHSVEAAVDPEEAFVAALSSCHMLWFLDLTRRAGYKVEQYTDKAEGVMEFVKPEKLAFTNVHLNPIVTFATEKPSDDEFMKLHDEAHNRCFIANSVKCKIDINPVLN